MASAVSNFKSTLSAPFSPSSPGSTRQQFALVAGAHLPGPFPAPSGCPSAGKGADAPLEPLEAKGKRRRRSKSSCTVPTTSSPGKLLRMPPSVCIIPFLRGRTPWEIKEGVGDYNMRFDMPGMARDDVRVWVEGNMLVVKAEKLPSSGSEDRQQGEKEQDEAWSAKSYGRYNSRILLPDHIVVDKIKAEVKDGVLYITIPKASRKVVDIDVQ
ncbi:unnamed protein product [Spirodela intermedia]|uniref:SHSP domain-containing protein n=1 Tax=Spirodela intermedia TaxID=51605 RepID=A0A7I8IQ09_SPIIN|nr:unnamed protein product [Spirodela intermedia]CAA6659583.1 unnamed protein product [Spirodela intermedia]